MDLLLLSCRSCDCSLYIDLVKYPRHSSYIVIFVEVPGFILLSQLYVSILARRHLRKFSDELLNALTDLEQILLKKLSVIFRLANVLTVARKSSETNFSLKVDGKTIFLDMGEGWLKDNPLNEANLELEKELLTRQGFELQIK